jgi:predicted kinase
VFIAMAGLPGSGKSTLAELVGDRLGIAVVSVDPIESSILRAGIESSQPTGLAAYLVAGTLAESIIRTGRSLIIDAVNAPLPAREQWVDIATRMNTPIRFVEVVCSDPEVHRARLEKRGRSVPDIVERSWHAVEQSLDDYAQWAGPSADFPRLTLDSIEPREHNVERAVSFISAP